MVLALPQRRSRNRETAVSQLFDNRELLGERECGQALPKAAFAFEDPL